MFSPIKPTECLTFHFGKSKLDFIVMGSINSKDKLHVLTEVLFLQIDIGSKKFSINCARDPDLRKFSGRDCIFCYHYAFLKNIFFVYVCL